MIVNSLKDGVYILPEAGEEMYTDFTITPLTLGGCPINSKIITEEIKPEGVKVTLPDGKYKLTFSGPTAVDSEKVFPVFYNGLPSFIDKIQNVLCPCTNCDNADKDELLLEALFYTNGFMQRAGFACGQNGYTLAVEKYYEILSKVVEYEQYYGTFVFSYKKAVQDVLVYSYVDLYLSLTDAVRTGQDALEELNLLLKVDVMERCLYRAGYVFSEIICDINENKCDCNEL